MLGDMQRAQFNHLISIAAAPRPLQLVRVTKCTRLEAGLPLGIHCSPEKITLYENIIVNFDIGYGCPVGSWQCSHLPSRLIRILITSWIAVPPRDIEDLFVIFKSINPRKIYHFQGVTRRVISKQFCCIAMQNCRRVCASAAVVAGHAAELGGATRPFPVYDWGPCYVKVSKSLGRSGNMHRVHLTELPV